VAASRRGADAPTVTLLSAGRRRGRAPLRYALRPGDAHEVRTELAMTITAGDGDEVVLPLVTAVYAAGVLPVDDAPGVARVRLTLQALVPDDLPGASFAADEVADELAAAVGATVEAVVSDRGLERDVVVAAPPGVEPGLLDQLTPGWLAFPAEAVAEGARWTVTRRGLAELDATVVTTYELIGRDGGVAVLRATTRIDGPAQRVVRDGRTVRVRRLHGAGTLDARFDPARPFAAATRTQALTLVVSVDGDAVATTTRLAQVVTPRRPDRPHPAGAGAGERTVSP
jgi:hypothetical protein